MLGFSAGSLFTNVLYKCLSTNPFLSKIKKGIAEYSGTQFQILNSTNSVGLRMIKLLFFCMYGKLVIIYSDALQP